jgi:hypothetical protein
MKPLRNSLKEKITIFALVMIACLCVQPVFAKRDVKNVVAGRWTEAKANAWYAPAALDVGLRLHPGHGYQSD